MANKLKRAVPPTAAISDFQTWIKRTFVREPASAYLDESRETRLRVRATLNDVVLDADQARELAWQIKKMFCQGCGGTGINPIRSGEECEYCGALPF